MSPEEWLLVYLDLMEAYKGLILANELHLLYMLTPISLSFNVNWQLYHSIFKKLLPIEQRICEMIGISEDVIVAYS